MIHSYQLTVIDFLTAPAIVAATAEINPPFYTITNKVEKLRGESLNMFLSALVLDMAKNRNGKNIICIKETLKNNTWQQDDDELEMQNCISKLIYERASLLNLPIFYVPYEEYVTIAEEILIESE